MGGTKSNHHQTEESKDGTGFPGCRGGGPKRRELIFPKVTKQVLYKTGHPDFRLVSAERGMRPFCLPKKEGLCLGQGLMKKREAESSGK